MFSESPFTGVCAYATYEVLAMLVGTLLMGVLLGYLIWGWVGQNVTRMKKHIRMVRRMQDLEQSRAASLQLRIDALKNSLARARTRNASSENLLRLTTQEKEVLMAELNTLQIELEAAKSESGTMRHTSEIHTTSPGDRSVVADNSLSDEPTLADISQAMQAGLHTGEADDESTEAQDTSLIVSRGTLPDVLQSAEKVFGRPVAADDLTLIQGVGVKMAGILHRAGIDSWHALAHCRLPDLRQMIEDAGPRYREYDPLSWPVQARMAAKGEWRKLKAYQESLTRKE